MPPTQQEEVPNCGRSAIGPVHDVMGVTPALRPVATGKPAATVAHDHSASHRWRNDGRPPADVERLGATRKHDTHQGGVADMTLRDLPWDRTGLVELRAACRVARKHPGVDRERDVRPLAADHRPVRVVEPLPTDLAQRVGPPLRGRALVIVAVRPRLGVEDRAQGGEERFAGFGVEVAVDPDYPQIRRGGVQPPPRSRRVVGPEGLGRGRPAGARRRRRAGGRRPRASWPPPRAAAPTDRMLADRSRAPPRAP